MDRLRELRGADTRERDLANLLGFEHSRAVRWKEGQMYVDRAEYLVRLADALDVETMLLVTVASGALNVEQAQRQLGRAARSSSHSQGQGQGQGQEQGQGDNGKRRARGPKPELGDLSADAAQFAIDPARFDTATRGVVLLIAASGEGRGELGAALVRHAEVGGLCATSFSLGVCLAERHRPEMVLLDLGLASVQAFDACRVLSGLTSRSQRRCRVVAGTTNLTDEVERPALMAGAATVTLFPFAQGLIENELDRLEERLGPRKSLKEVRRHV
jgi:CheY-like chemotaxis protein